MSEIAKLRNQEKAKKKLLNNEWYSLRSILGNAWAIFYFLLGGREAGKSYAVTRFFVDQFINKGRPFYWLRLTDASKEKLLKNKAEKLIDPDIRRDYNLELTVKGDNVYNTVNGVKKKMCTVLSLSTFYNDKGSGLFDKDFLKDKNMFYNICLDEMNRELNERKTFDILYAFTNQIENLVRSTKQRLRIICIGNTLEEASDLLCAFNFIPEKFGRYYLKSKRAVIDYIEPSEKYKERRKGTVADILMPTASTFTNQIDTDTTLVYKGRLNRPTFVIKFKKDKSSWFTCWDNKVISPFNGEQTTTISMRPYLDDNFIPKLRDNVYLMFDNRLYQFRNLISFKTFQKELELLRPTK